MTKPQICVSAGVVMPCSSTGKRDRDPASPSQGSKEALLGVEGRFLVLSAWLSRALSCLSFCVRELG